MRVGAGWCGVVRCVAERCMVECLGKYEVFEEIVRDGTALVAIG